MCIPKYQMFKGAIFVNLKEEHTFDMWQKFIFLFKSKQAVDLYNSLLMCMFFFYSICFFFYT